MAISDFITRIANFSRSIHITQAILVLGAFVIGCALVADSSMQRSRSTMLVLVYSIKSAIFILYQYLTKHTARFQRWGSLRAYAILDTLDTLLWFTAFIINCMGGGRCNGSSCVLLGLAATVSLFLSFTYILTATMAWRNFRAGKKVSVEYAV